MMEYENQVFAQGKIKKLTKRLKSMSNFHQELVQQENVLKEQLRNSKLFLNMCVHDLKNPTTSILQGL